jgi:hypothetical protein
VLFLHGAAAPLMLPGVAGAACLAIVNNLSLLEPEQLFAFTFNVPEVNALA